MNIRCNNLSGDDPGLLVKSVNNLETLYIGNTKLIQQQAAAIFSAVSEGSRLTELYIIFNDLREFDPGLLAQAVTNLGIFDVRFTDLTHQQEKAVLNAVSEKYKLTTLNILGNDLLRINPELLAKVATKL